MSLFGRIKYLITVFNTLILNRILIHSLGQRQKLYPPQLSVLNFYEQLIEYRAEKWDQEGNKLSSSD
jgi:hypothetical protein